MSERFHISDTNPNDNSGGGGCVCSETKVVDCEAPFAVFFHTEMENPLSPHTVVCARCLQSACEAIEYDEPLSAGEPVIHMSGAEGAKVEDGQINQYEPAEESEDVPEV